MSKNSEHIFPGRKLRVCFWNYSPAVASMEMLRIENELKRLGTLQIVQLKTLDDPTLLPCDLLIMNAQYVEEETFSTWLKGVEPRLAMQGGIRVPAIIYAKVDPGVQRELIQWAVASNWYFDILEYSHVDSLAIRAANFLRLHDHLHEVQRMNKALSELNERVHNLESALHQKVKDLSGAPS